LAVGDEPLRPIRRRAGAQDAVADGGRTNLNGLERL